ncbi:MAG TPA: ribosome biogenesis GTP-binding protein YihA/YsxC [Rhizomicrobium sp.]|nr:ribosome biogenesis GTP-binding protein YihA/YsxC [Rhizomicrobium sp.]HUB84770.1 ribosome biogenesis GTP-binding protein YihA/YsxC [Rhizomicrobium sp.]
MNGRKLFAGSCAFVAGAATAEALPKGSLPEIAFVGRSNVGKSSLINALTGRRTLARVSHTPGATRQINFFRLGEGCMLVDLPGYGYAKTSRALSREWQNLIFTYLRGRSNLVRALLLIDARRGIMPPDREAMDLLDQSAVSYAGVLTKLDELAKQEQERVRVASAGELSRRTAAFPELFATSARKAEGLEPLRDHVAALAGAWRNGL